MIGLLVDWHADTVDPVAARRFTGALGAGLTKPLAQYAIDGAILAGASLVARDASRWRARPVENGGWLAFTGFILNLDDLRRDLDHPRADAADLYAAGYARWGDAVDLRAIGEFATILAVPNARRIRAARSPILAPPLHLWHDADRAVIASTPRAVLAAADLPAEIDEQKIADSLCLNYDDTTRGWYKGVRRLEAGARVWLSPEAARTARYYDLYAAPAVRFRRDEDYVAAASGLLAEGTKLALAGFSRPAISLSGGLDSQAVAAFALAQRPDQYLRGLTSVPEPGLAPTERSDIFEDERDHVAALAAMYPMLETELIDSAGVPLDHKLTAMFLMGGVAPRNVLNFPWLHRLHERAREADCDVLLTGAMGNLGFSFDGAGALPSWMVRGRWLRLAREIWGRREHGGVARVAARDTLLPLLPSPLRSWLRRSPMDDPLSTWCPIGREYAREMRVHDRIDLFADTRWRSTLAKRKAMFVGAGNELGDVHQGFAAIHGVPVRDPTAYRPLLELCIGMPDDQFLRGGQTRWLARRMLRDRIPDVVQTERRNGRQAADAPIKLGRMHAALIDELDALARDPAMAARFDLPRLRATLADWQPGSRFSPGQVATLRLAVPRVLATARFIRYVEGTNA